MRSMTLFLALIAIFLCTFSINIVNAQDGGDDTTEEPLTYALKGAKMRFKATYKFSQFDTAFNNFLSTCQSPVDAVIQAASLTDFNLFQVHILMPETTVATQPCNSQAFLTAMEPFAEVTSQLTTTTLPYNISLCTRPNEDGVPTTLECASRGPLCEAILCPLNAICETTTQCQIGQCTEHKCFNSANSIFNIAVIMAIVVGSVIIGM